MRQFSIGWGSRENPWIKQSSGSPPIIAHQSPAHRRRQITVGKFIDVLGQHAGNQARGADGPARSQVTNPVAERLVQFAWQRGEELVEEGSHLMVHPLHGERFMTSEHKRQSGAHRSAASLQDPGCFIQRNRAFAADDTQQRVLVHTGLAGNLVSRFTRSIHCAAQRACKALIGRVGHGRQVGHRRVTPSRSHDSQAYRSLLPVGNQKEQ